jgi:hypothetical protein
MLSHKLEKIIFKLSNVCDFCYIIDRISKNRVLRKLQPFITAIITAISHYHIIYYSLIKQVMNYRVIKRHAG